MTYFLVILCTFLLSLVIINIYIYRKFARLKQSMEALSEKGGIKESFESLTTEANKKNKSEDNKSIETLPLENTTSSLSKVIEQQSVTIDGLQKELGKFKRASTGVSLKWTAPREDKSSYLLMLYNDFPERIFNINILVEEAYQNYCKIHCEDFTCDSNKSLKIYFVPGVWANNNSDQSVSRQEFSEVWLNNKLKPIKFTIFYTKSPSNTNIETLEIYFALDNLSKHFKAALNSIKSCLTIVSPKK